MNSARSLPSWNAASFDSRLHTALFVLLVTFLCYMGDRLAFVLGIPPDQIASLWPSTPLLVAVLLLTPRKIWPWLITAGLAAIALADLRDGALFAERFGTPWATPANYSFRLPESISFSRACRS